jgi:hypothetical protein
MNQIDRIRTIANEWQRPESKLSSRAAMTKIVEVLASAPEPGPQRPLQPTPPRTKALRAKSGLLG